MNQASILGLIFGITAVAGGNFLESGKISSLLQPNAALIVFGGTFGAILLSFPLRDVLKALSSLGDVFIEIKSDAHSSIEDLVRYSSIVRKGGLYALETEIPKITDRFLKKAITLASDQMNSRVLRETMERENLTYEIEKRRIAKVYETAGGFAPTIGIIGAVLGLVHVMENLSDPSRLGSGIAVAFVATIYGVASANLIFLPIAKKLLNRLSYELSVREMLVEGVMGIQAGLNPHYLRERLKVFLEEETLK